MSQVFSAIVMWVNRAAPVRSRPAIQISILPTRLGLRSLTKKKKNLKPGTGDTSRSCIRGLATRFYPTHLRFSGLPGHSITDQIKPAQGHLKEGNCASVGCCGLGPGSLQGWRLAKGYAAFFRAYICLATHNGEGYAF